MITSITCNNCLGLVYTTTVENDFGTDEDFAKTQKARLERLEQQFRRWSETYSQRETMGADEYINGLDELADMSAELGDILKQTGPLNPTGFANTAMVNAETEILANTISSAARQYMRVGINVLPNDPRIIEYRNDAMWEALAMMKAASSGSARGAILPSSVRGMRNIVAAWRSRTSTPTSRTGPGRGVVVKPVPPPAARLPQDVSVNPRPPPAKSTGTIGKSSAQNAELSQDISNARANGATDIRVNQQQVNAAGERVGINRPDLQYTRADGTRVYIEYDAPPATRAAGHQTRINANDPIGVVILKTIP